MAAALRPGLSTPVRPMAVDEWVPDSFRRDVQSIISMREAQGARVYAIQMPADTFAELMTQAKSSTLLPYSPTLLGVPLLPWGQSHLGIMADKHEAPQPLLFDAAGRELDITQEG